MEQTIVLKCSHFSATYTQVYKIQLRGGANFLQRETSLEKTIEHMENFVVKVPESFQRFHKMRLFIPMNENSSTIQVRTCCGSS